MQELTSRKPTKAKRGCCGHGWNRVVDLLRKEPEREIKTLL